jgi:hypothetical protein
LTSWLIESRLLRPAHLQSEQRANGRDLEIEFARMPDEGEPVGPRPRLRQRGLPAHLGAACQQEQRTYHDHNHARIYLRPFWESESGLDSPAVFSLDADRLKKHLDDPGYDEDALHGGD